MKNQSLRGVWVAAWILSLAVQPGLAQTNAEVNAGIQFNFSTPGARSLGLGGAFLGLADDATAAYTNPAGLTALSAPEVSVEGRSWSFTHVFTDRGRRTGEPTQQGVDTISGLRNGSAEDSVSGVSFLSFVLPRKRWAIALYGHELARFDASFRAQGVILEGSLESSVRLRPTQNSLSLEIVNIGVAAAYRIHDDLSLGVGFSSYDFDVTASTRRYETTNLTNPQDITGPGGRLGPPSYADASLYDLQTQTGVDRAVGISAGFLWQIGEAWRLGGVYRQGPEFDFDATYSPGPKSPVDWTDPNNPKPLFPEFTRRARFRVPSVVGLGVSFLPREDTSFTLDYVLVEYSHMIDDLTNIYPESEVPQQELSHFQMDDASEVHLGIERFLSVKSALFALRLGAWHDPEHKVRYGGSSSRFLTLFRPGEDAIHYSAGIGVIRSNYQVDAAFDFSEHVSTASLSTVIRF